MRQSIDPRIWDKECQTDWVRNSFVIPLLERELQGSIVTKFLDLGCGSNYIVRQLIHRKKIQVKEWALLDRDPEMLNFSKNSLPSAKNLRFIEADFHDLSREKNRISAQVAISVFSLIEVDQLKVFVSAVSNSVAPGGVFFLFIPDFLQDILKQELQTGQELNFLSEYCHGMVSIVKPNKFTGNPLPFFAHRTEEIIAEFSGKSLRLININSAICPDGNRTFCLVFCHEHLK